MEYSKIEEKLISAQWHLKLCFLYQEYSICSVLLSDGQELKQTLEISTFTYYLNLGTL